MSNFGFLKVNNNIIWNCNDGDNTTLKNINDKVVYILGYLYCNTTKTHRTVFSIEDMIEYAGLKVDTHKGKSVEQFRNTLIAMEKEGLIIDCSKDLSKVKYDVLVRCDIKDDYEDNFFKLCSDKIVDIIDNKTKSKKITLINVYSYINARLYHRKEGESSIKEGGKAECCFLSDEMFTKDLLIAKNTLHKALEDLKELGLIFYDNIGLVANSKGKTMATNVYVLNDEELKVGLDQSKKYYKDSGYSCTKKANKLDNQINGTKGAIKRAEKSGKDITELINKLEKLQSQLESLDKDNRRELIKDIKDKFNYIDKNDKDGNITNVYDSIYDYLKDGEVTLYDCSFERLQQIRDRFDNMIDKINQSR